MLQMYDKAGKAILITAYQAEAHIQQATVGIAFFSPEDIQVPAFAIIYASPPDHFGGAGGGPGGINKGG